jgi:hypothetical protein
MLFMGVTAGVSVVSQALPGLGQCTSQVSPGVPLLALGPQKLCKLPPRVPAPPLLEEEGHVRAFKARKVDEGLDPNTVGVMQGVLSTALNQAVDDGLIPSNPASRVKKAVKRDQAPMRSLCPRKRPQGSYGPL